MKPKIMNTPYPILYCGGEEYEKGIRGYKDGNTISVMVSPSVTPGGDLKCALSVSLACDFLKKEIDDGRARFFAHLECPGTSYRDFRVWGPEPDGEIDVSCSMLKGTLEVFCGIVAVEGNSVFSSESFSESFWSRDDANNPVPAKFELKNGDSLAVAGGAVIPLTNGRNGGSLVRITDVGNDEPDSPFDTQGDVINVNLAHSQFEAYRAKPTGLPRAAVLLATIFPAVAAALSQVAVAQSDPANVQEEADDESDDFVSGIGKHRWIESLRNAVHELVGLGRFKREMSELRKEDVENGITFRLAAEICARHFERPDAEWTNPIVRALSPEPTEED